MSRTIHHILAIAALALLTLGVGSCVEPLDPSLRPEGPSVSFWIYVPGSMQQPVTKGLPGDVASLSPESTLKDVQVWAFRHGAGDDEAPLSTATVSNIDWKHSGTTPRSWDDCYEMSMPIPEDFLKDSDPRIDFYVLANWRSIFSTKPASQTTLAAVRDMIYNSVDVRYFGIENPTRTVPGTGLPISTSYKGEDGKGVSLKFLKEAYEAGTKPTQQLFKDNLKVIELKRTVSKLRFVISRPEGVDGVSITKIVVNEQLIPFENWVFENADPILPQPATYGAAALELKGSGTEPLLTAEAIGQCEDPKVFSGEWFETEKPSGYPQTAQGYDTYLREAIDADSPKATEVVVYLRETDKAIAGTVYYKLSNDADATEYAAPFTMGNLDTKYNNFRRNHYWTVYAYFEVDGKLYVKPTVADWNDIDRLDYTIKMNTNMRLFDSWLYRYDTVDQDYTNWTNWAGSHMVVSDGRVTETSTAEPVAGRPLRSPQIQLVTTGVTGSSFDLKVDNSDFEIVQAVKNNVGVVTSYVASTGGALNIPAGDNVYTYFYIVPKVGVTPANPVAKVTLIYNDPVVGPQKVTFNYNALPGYSDDSSEIWAYYFPADQYNITGKLKMYYQDYNHPLVPTPAQN